MQIRQHKLQCARRLLSARSGLRQLGRKETSKTSDMIATDTIATDQETDSGEDRPRC